MVKYLDQNLLHYAEILARDTGREVRDLPGAGAAGGLGAGLMAFLGAKASPGIHLVLDQVGFDGLVKDCDLVITGEGRIDGQTLRGKVPLGVAKRSNGKPVVAIVGDIGDDLGNIYENGITAVLSTNRKRIPFSEAKPRAKDDLLKTAETLMRLVNLGKSIQN
jgi:glycerate kinase